MSFVKVLNAGYVRLVDHMGSDLTVVNAARVSYAKESLELSERMFSVTQVNSDVHHYFYCLKAPAY
ncbi:hypothetical protein ACFPYJ_32490 [Paenibacillus solisilvae]|uniref:Uncharacterized protein n=1 Tax=Paenibacillus solisilvae TaxID=2486751 RepID=A0ABW0W6C4_9BACL